MISFAERLISSSISSNPNSQTIPDDRKIWSPLAVGGYAFALPDQGVRLDFRYLRHDRHHLHAELDVQCDWPGAKGVAGSLTCADITVSSPSARERRAQTCQKRGKRDDFDWLSVIDEGCPRVIAAERNGTEPVVLSDVPLSAKPPEETVYGLAIPTDSHSQIIADADGLKSWLLLAILGVLANRGNPGIVARLGMESAVPPPARCAPAASLSLPAELPVGADPR